MSVRYPYVSGSFYPHNSKKLKQAIEESFLHKLGPGKLPASRETHRSISALVAPHAGYIFSGPAAAHAYYALSEESAPSTAVILCPNHTGLGSAVSMMDSGRWETPLGKVNIDAVLAGSLYRDSDIIDIDADAHRYEHSIEVHLPFLQYLYGSNIMLVPICMGVQDLETSRSVGEIIASATMNKNVIIIASTDLTHQESQESANRKDRLVLKAIELMDEELLNKTVAENKITMCGYGPVQAALIASKQLGANKAEVLTYYTSGDITGDYGGVVGYGSARVTRPV